MTVLRFSKREGSHGRRFILDSAQRLWRQPAGARERTNEACSWDGRHRHHFQNLFAWRLRTSSVKSSKREYLAVTLGFRAKPNRRHTIGFRPSPSTKVSTWNFGKGSLVRVPCIRGMTVDGYAADYGNQARRTPLGRQRNFIESIVKFPAAAWFSTVMAPQPVFQELCRFAAGRQLKKPRYVRGVARPPHCRSYTLQPSVNFRWLPAPATTFTERRSASRSAVFLRPAPPSSRAISIILARSPTSSISSPPSAAGRKITRSIKVRMSSLASVRVTLPPEAYPF